MATGRLTGKIAGPVSGSDLSCRLPLLVLFVSAAVWLVLGSAFSLIASLKFHSPNFLADCAWLTYGRVRPACNNSLLYGFCLQAGLGVALWLFTRLGGTALAQRWLVTVGAILWNTGVTVGVLGILAGDSAGFENLEMPRYAALVLFLGYLMVGLGGVLTFHQRRQRALFASQWFVLAALFWFPWIYSTAELLLVMFPVRGVAQSVIAWWYTDNIQLVWLGLVGVATVFYFLPKLTERELHSGYLALFAFWTLILFGSWCGIPNSAPLPAWMPALSTVASVLTIIPIVTVALNIYGTLRGERGSVGAWERGSVGTTLRRSDAPRSDAAILQFIGTGVIAFMVAGLMNALGAPLHHSQVTDFTWFIPARVQLGSYGFFAMVMFGAMYYIVPRLVGIEFPSPKFIRAHFWLALLGLLLTVVPLAIGGIVQGLELQNATIPFTEVVKATLPFLRVSTLGDVLIALGHICFLANLAGLVARFSRARATAAYAAATAGLFESEGAKL